MARREPRKGPCFRCRPSRRKIISACYSRYGRGGLGPGGAPAAGLTRGWHEPTVTSKSYRVLRLKHSVP
jgi:hypothetical protein